MNAVRVVAALLLACSAALSYGQNTKERGSVPLGTARDGSGPAHGALKGGSLEPDIRLSPAPQRDIKRCRELGATLRDDCLRDLGAVAEKAPARSQQPDPKY